MKRRKKIISVTLIFIIICVSILYFAPELTNKNTNYNLTSKVNKISYTIFRKNSALQNLSSALYASGDYKESSYYYAILLSKNSYLNSKGQDFRDLTFYNYMVSLFNSGQKSKFIQEYDNYLKSSKNEITMRILLIGIIKESPNVEKVDLSYALTQYLSLIDHPDINQNNNLFKVYGGLIKVYEGLEDIDSANIYKEKAKAYLEKISSK